MKHILPIILFSALLAACGGGDKAAKLEKLRAQALEIQGEIQALEAELNASQSTGADSSKTKAVVVTPVAIGQFRHYIDIQGNIDAEESVMVQPKMPGVVTRVYVTEGSSVSAGQLIAELDNAPYQAQVSALRPQLELATEVFNRQQRLWDQKIGSEIQYLQAKTNKESLEKQLALAQEQLEMTKIKAPISGVIDFAGAKVGQFASPQNPEPAFRIVNLSKLKVKAELAESYARQVKKGNNVVVFFPDLNQEIQSQVTYVARYINPLTRTFSAEVALKSDAAYQPNMIATLKIVDYQNEAAIAVPINLVQTTNGEQFVYVASQENGKTIARKKVVTLGLTYNGTVEITDGLKEGDSLITSGQFDLVEGAEIKL